MDLDGKLRFAAQSLAVAEDFLRKAADAYPVLEGPGRAFHRMARAATRPLRIGILGESNSGKSSLANLLVGIPTLPALPVPNTRLPVLLKYAPVPSAAGVYENGERITLAAGKNYPEIKYLEVGLPSDILRSVEILDFPASRNVPFPARRHDPASYGIHAAIWTTVATQAWRASEQAQWLELPPAIRSRGLLAVTYCDMVMGGQKDLKRLLARLETTAKPHFRGICFVDGGDDDPAAMATQNKTIFLQVQYLAQEFSAERLGKAMAIARRVMTNALGKVGHGTESGARMGLPIGPGAEAYRFAFEEDWPKTLNRPLPEGRFDKPAILLGAPSPSRPSRPAAETAPPASRRSASRSFKWRPPAATISAAIVLASAAAFAALQLGLIETGKTPPSSPAPNASEAAGQSTTAEAAAAEAHRKAEAETAAAEAHRRAEAETAAAEAHRKTEAETAAAEAHRKAEAETAAAEAHGRAEAEAAAAEEHRKAEAEAVAAEAHRKAEAEAAAAEAHRKAAAAEARRRAEAERRGKAEAEAERRRRSEAAEPPHRSGGSSPMMVGVGQ